MSIPPTSRKIVAHTLSLDFRAATRIETFDIPQTLEPKQVLVRNAFAGINAADVNFPASTLVSAHWRHASTARVGVPPPLEPGFESVGEVVRVGSSVTNVKVGDSVAVSGIVGTKLSGFSEYRLQEAENAIPIPSVDFKYIPLVASGLTASLALEQVGEMKQVGVDGAKQETVVVTAAAGGTGVFAVQLAKLAGHHVVATCSSDDKVAFLKGLGADRVINYKKEDFGEVLKKEYPSGVDLVYECVGGSMFEDCVKNLAFKGRLIVIGFLSGYRNGAAFKATSSATAVDSESDLPPLPMLLLGKCASVRGFMMMAFASEIPRHWERLTRMLHQGQLKSIVDTTPFVGLEAVPDALDHLFAGGNIGKVVVDLRQREK